MLKLKVHCLRRQESGLLSETPRKGEVSHVIALHLKSRNRPPAIGKVEISQRPGNIWAPQLHVLLRLTRKTSRYCGGTPRIESEEELKMK